GEPLRFDFFGDQVETIRAFDPETQISKRALPEALLTSVSEILLDDQSVLRFRKSFSAAFGAVNDVLYDSISARIRRQGAEQFLRSFSHGLDTLFDAGGPEALVAFDAPAEEATKDRFETAQDPYDSRKAAPLARGAHPFRAPDPPLLYLDPEALKTAVG